MQKLNIDQKIKIAEMAVQLAAAVISSPKSIKMQNIDYSLTHENKLIDVYLAAEAIITKSITRQSDTD